MSNIERRTCQPHCHLMTFELISELLITMEYVPKRNIMDVGLDNGRGETFQITDNINNNNIEWSNDNHKRWFKWHAYYKTETYFNSLEKEDSKKFSKRNE